MKNANVRFSCWFFVLMISLFSLGVATSYAQIGELGIYGSVPESKRANTRYVHVEPNDTDDPIGYTIPVNGLKNFNFFYLSTGLGFLPGQHYTVSYLDASQSSLGSEIVNYTPNSGHTNGTQVSTPFNIPIGYETTPRGLHGTIYGRIGGVNYVFPNARVAATGRGTQVLIHVTTNDAGYFNTYYQNGDARAFLPVHPSVGIERYDLIVTGFLNGCAFGQILLLNAEWGPLNTTDPSLASYFVDAAELDLGNVIVEPNQCLSD
jgi:hypothetical protein